MFYLCIIIHVKVKFATSDLVSYYLIHVIFFFQFIPCTYVIFCLLCALLALELLLYIIIKKRFLWNILMLHLFA